jgi:histidinol-phosphatase (PHP family)
MKLCSLHTHTSLCDGAGTVDDYCRAAIEKHFSILGFSAHAPIEKLSGIKSDWHLKEGDLQKYLDEVSGAKIKYRGKLTVLSGLEADYVDGISGPADWNRRRAELGLDFIIGSVHYIPLPQRGIGLNQKKLFQEIDGTREKFLRLLTDGFRGNAGELVKTYWRCVKNMAEAGGFDILGHIDLVKKNNPDDELFSTKLSDEVYGQGFFSALDAITVQCQSTWSATGKIPFAIEINTGALAREKYNDTYPSVEIMKEISLRQIPMTISGDDHSPASLGKFHDYAVSNAIKAGIRELYYFDNSRRWVTEDLQKKERTDIRSIF